MIHLISGEKGKGKTKILISKANEEVMSAKGNVVFLDKSNKHMYELSNKIRLINVRDYLVTNMGEFIGFVSGIISQDHDLERVFLDGFMKIASLEKSSDVEIVLDKLSALSEKFCVEIVISISMDIEGIPEKYKKNVIVSL